jgi:hypothetical protein
MSTGVFRKKVQDEQVTSFDVAALEKRFLNGDATVAIIGLGYVGIPLAK